jgi:hypothetical protein
MDKKFTYNEIGPESWYQYDSSDINTSKTFIISDNLSTLNVVKGEDNGIKRMITCVDNIGKEITELEDECFKECTNLTSINLPHTLQSIGSEVFKDCYNLSSFKDGVFNIPTNMGNNVFENCDFERFYIKDKGNNTEEDIIVGEKTFCNNRNLKNISVDNIIFS